MICSHLLRSFASTPAICPNLHTPNFMCSKESAWNQYNRSLPLHTNKSRKTTRPKQRAPASTAHRTKLRSEANSPRLREAGGVLHGPAKGLAPGSINMHNRAQMQPASHIRKINASFNSLLGDLGSPHQEMLQLLSAPLAKSQALSPPKKPFVPPFPFNVCLWPSSSGSL